ncbi:hypothetical protein EJV47_07030 [Hymenobacter gummosus]|uniref:Uncharacterized protein n=1 Tax=Hymenobacter gummosus TaxID=1776032 RepID=A0A3S0QJE1_9BACT|nr:hypothetical protein [Hymenobacter gummosus]RTQ51545.1 hypothetical protein EJV47_07030 [Hymenobacter gummosus]
MTATGRYWWGYALLVAGLVALMAVGLDSPFVKGGMGQVDEQLALGGLLLGGLLLTLAAGLRRWFDQLLLPLLAVPLLHRLVAAVSEQVVSSPVLDLSKLQWFSGLMYTSTLLSFYGLLMLYKQWQKRVVRA